LGSKKQKKIENLPSASLALGKDCLCRVLGQGHSAKNFLKENFQKRLKSLCREPNGDALGKYCRQEMDVVSGGVAEGRTLALGKELLLPCACICRGSGPRQRLFVECPSIYPRQILRPSAKMLCPVVKVVAKHNGERPVICNTKSDFFPQ